MIETFSGIHLEPTNICTLKCPSCARTNFMKDFPNKWKNSNIDLDHLKSFIDIDLTGKNVLLNGNTGDPIYYPHIFELVQFLKSQNAKICIHTNGSYRSKEWWQQLNDLLDSNDLVVFSIDGIPKNFTEYRINADWESIKIGIDVLTAGNPKVAWKYIVFKYNQDNLREAELLSKEFGIDEFVPVNSDRWIENDVYMPEITIPVSKKIIDIRASAGNRYEHTIQWKPENKHLMIDPRCKKTQDSHFISAQGFYMPCCRVGDYRFYYSSEFYKNKNLYDISKTTLSEVLEITKDFYYNLESSKHKYCTFNCPKI